MELETFIRDVPDFPKPGILFKDITPLLQDPQALSLTIDKLADAFKNHNIDIVAGAEARGFIFGPGIAERLGIGFVPIRKPGKLPSNTVSHSYDLEYGQDTLEMHQDAIKSGQNVLLVDDLLATGGTIHACSELVKKLGGNVSGMAFLIELSFLQGRAKFPETTVYSLIQYDS